MYRDEHDAVRARLEAARDRREEVLREIGERMQTVAALSEKLRERKLSSVRVKAPVEKVALPPEFASLSLEEEVRLADAVERDSARLEAECERLSTTIALLNDRARGKKVREPLAPPPRRVPASYLIAELVTWSGVFALLIGASAIGAGNAGAFGPILSCLGVSLLRPAQLAYRFLGMVILLACVWTLMAVASSAIGETSPFTQYPRLAVGLAVLAVLAADARHAWRRRAFLAHCKVATAHLVHSRRGGSSYTNWPLPYGRGWESGVERYSGRSRVSEIAYTTDEGDEGEITVRGRPWEDAVVLYDPAHPSRAEPVQHLTCNPKPTLAGEWSGKLGVRNLIRVGFMLVGLALLIFGMVR